MSKSKSIWLWVFSIIFTLLVAYFQRVTGPTYPITGKITINGNDVRYKLPRTSDAENGEPVKILIPDKAITGEFTYKRYKSFDTVTKVPMTRNGDYLTAIVPNQPAAGKVEYSITLYGDNTGTVVLPEKNENVIIRYKGQVPTGVLIIHVITIFLAMLFSARTGVEAFYKGVKTYRYAFLTLVALFIGGLILGPIVQKYAFDAYWTGWPFGHDLTDNKTLIGFIFWGIAFFKLSRNRKNFKWAIIAAIVLLLVYSIPHSVLGSEIDYTAK